jgi:hypothetical protein
LDAQALIDAGYMTLDGIKQTLCDQINIHHSTLLNRGFAFQEQQFSAEGSLLQRVTGILTASLAGIPTGWPLPWPKQDDTPTQFADLDTFKAFAGALLDFVRVCDTSVGTVKIEVRTAANVEEAKKALADWIVAEGLA